MRTRARGPSPSPHCRLILKVTEGYYVNLLRVRASGVLSRHRHSGPVHAFTLRGEWHYLEHDWIARTGDYVFEPPGETHTLDVLGGETEMITLFQRHWRLHIRRSHGKPVGL